MPESETSTSTVELWGFEFRWRASGSYPLEYRRAGGCRHDWGTVSFDHPLVAALRAATTNPGPAHLCEPGVRSDG